MSGTWRAGSGASSCHLHWIANSPTRRLTGDGHSCFRRDGCAALHDLDRRPGIICTSPLCRRLLPKRRDWRASRNASARTRCIIRSVPGGLRDGDQPANDGSQCAHRYCVGRVERSAEAQNQRLPMRVVVYDYTVAEPAILQQAQRAVTRRPPRDRESSRSEGGSAPRVHAPRGRTAPGGPARPASQPAGS